MFTKMVSMAHTPEEAKEEAAEMMPATASVPKYPYGLCISLDDDSLEKLGLAGDLPQVGDVVQFTAMARVTSASQNERETGEGKAEQECRVELQITDMGIPAVDAAEDQVARSAARRKRFYGASMVADTDNDAE